MRPAGFLAAGACLAIVALIAAGVAYLRITGLKSGPVPGALEAAAARYARQLAIPRESRLLRNPVALSPEVLAEGLEHYADHCAVCHGSDGSGNVEMGRGLYPKAPDMRQASTQTLSDGELFYIIENGVRFTGMPGWGTGTQAGEASSWQLVHFIRHLPELTEAELDRMDEFIPRSPDAIRLEIEEDRFLNQGVQ